VARGALIDFLKKGVLPPPTVLASSGEKDGEAQGSVKLDFAEGSLLLKSADGKFLRIVRDSAESKDERRHLPAGSYKLTGYHLTRRDAKGTEWFLAVNLRGGRPITLKAGQTLPLKTDPAVTIACKAKVAAGTVAVTAHVAGEHHAGVTLYKDGKRILIGYRITDRDGKLLGQGMLDYG
jgi:hypothetical protein